MYNQQDIADILNSFSDITDLLDTYDYAGTPYPMIVFGDKVPEDWGVSATSLNYYMLRQLNFDYQDSRWSIACRAPTYEGSFNLAATVKSSLHKHVTDVAFYANQLQTIRPSNDYDNYMTPVEIKVLGR